MKKLLILICLLYIHTFGLAQKISEPAAMSAEWVKPYAPFNIVGNSYYVGTTDLACYLVTTSGGNILINTGLAASTALIKASIEKLGFKFADTKILLTTQAHFDHMGAMAEIKKLTGAKFMVDRGDAGVATDGGLSDYYFGGNHSPFKPIKADRLLNDNDVIKLGGTKLTMLHHPGHTKGSCSFMLTVNGKKRMHKVLIANMPTIIIENRFADVKAYPEMAQDYAYTLKAMKALKFDIWVASHASQFNLAKKHQPGDKYNPAAFVDRKGYDAQLNELQKAFDKKVAGQRTAKIY
ncbi:subclass B3 metallo-beta-lactamase [Mucilaginibacter antarcticus]|uniref:Subclass B3 metallo-beta-lactamase n=1 Tax=Mucilaginibacter antarcticus TaxID=1855725 RepID=A0ABW5XLP7_9SPHI